MNVVKSAPWNLLILLTLPMSAIAIEEPAFRLIAEAEGVEVRAYEPFWVVERRVEARFVEAGNRAFRPLFNYISGANRAQEKIEMTAPVGQRPGGEPSANPVGEKIEMTAPVLQAASPGQKESYVVSFALPSRYRSRPAPAPTDPSLTLREVPARTVAALRYATWGADSKFEEFERRLREKITAAGWKPKGAAEFARYDAPYVPWFMRRNEVLIEIEPIADGAASAVRAPKGSS
jgi:hypothetical protein